MYKSLLLVFFGIVLFACQTPETEVADNSESTIETLPLETTPLLEIDLEDAQAENLLAATITIDVIYDAVFKRAKKYEAIPLKPYLKELVISQNLDTTDTEIIFLCKDGYNPSMSLNKVLQNEPYLVIKDLAAPEGKNWVDTLQGKWTPFYLVWPNNVKGTKGFTWPYGLKFLQFKTSDAAYKVAFPKDEKQIAGFELYKSKCMKCHSVNKVGGIMGPEFNIPKNITQYWQASDIKAFVKNPYSYRYNSKMPPVAGIKDEEIDQIISYLSYMKDYKIAVE